MWWSSEQTGTPPQYQKSRRLQRRALSHHSGLTPPSQTKALSPAAAHVSFHSDQHENSNSFRTPSAAGAHGSFVASMSGASGVVSHAEAAAQVEAELAMALSPAKPGSPMVANAPVASPQLAMHGVLRRRRCIAPLLYRSATRTVFLCFCALTAEWLTRVAPLYYLFCFSCPNTTGRTRAH